MAKLLRGLVKRRADAAPPAAISSGQQLDRARLESVNEQPAMESRTAQTRMDLQEEQSRMQQQLLSVAKESAVLTALYAYRAQRSEELSFEKG